MPEIQPTGTQLTFLLGLSNVILIILTIILIVATKTYLNHIVFIIVCIFSTITFLYILWNIYIIRQYHKFKNLTFIRSY